MNYNKEKMKILFKKMKFLNLLIFFSILILQIKSIASDFPYTLPEGNFVYKNQISFVKRTVTEVVDHTSESGKQRKKVLKKDLYTCFRKNQIQTLCSKTYLNEDVPDSVKIPVEKLMTSLNIQFKNAISSPVLIQDLTLEKRYQVTAQVQLGDNKLDYYQFIHYYQDQRNVVAFPISETQPIGFFDYLNGQLGYTLNLFERNNNIVTSYTVIAWLINNIK